MTMPSPFRHDGPPPGEVAPLARVVAVGDRAWALSLLRGLRRVEVGGLLLEWFPGQSSALDTKQIADGRGQQFDLWRARGRLQQEPRAVQKVRLWVGSIGSLLVSFSL